MSYEIGKVKNEAFEMNYVKFGKGEKAFVILPGLSVQSVIPSAAAIEQHYSIFEDEYTVYLFDRKENLPSVYSVSDMADDTAMAIKKLGLSDICLFGASQGGMISMIIAAAYPKLVNKLALGSSACKTNEERTANVKKWIKLAENGESEKLCLSFGEMLYPERMQKPLEKVLRQMAESVTQNDLKRFITLANAIEGFDITAMLGDIKCPVLVLGDKDDKVLGESAAYEIAEQFDGRDSFEIHMYEGYGHAAYDTAPGFTERLYNFFSISK